jgi:hypothetical protein
VRRMSLIDLYDDDEESDEEMEAVEVEIVDES